MTQLTKNRVKGIKIGWPASTGVRWIVGTGAISLVLAGCGGAGSASPGNANCPGGPAAKITVAYQPGLGYAPLLIAKRQKTLDSSVPGTSVEWRVLNSGAAIRDGMLSGDIQIGAGGIGPFLVGYDAGVKWKVITSMDNMNLKLMAIDPKITSVKNLKGAGKIAMPGPDSIQSVVVRKGAADQLGDAHALDSQFVAMGHPDGVQALVGGQLAAHMTSPPFQGQEATQGAHSILSSYDVLGEHTFNSIFATTDVQACNPKFVAALITAVTDANTMLTNDPVAAAKILAPEMGGATADSVGKLITSPDIKWTTKPQGFGVFAKFMEEIKLIKKMPKTADLFFKNEATSGGN